MPLTKTNTGIAIRGRVVPNASQRKDSQEVMAMAQFADLGRGAGTLHTSASRVARLDMQGQTAEGDNLQVQIGTGTVAAVIVAATVQNTADPTNRRGVDNAINSVLNQSMDSGTVWKITGSLP